ncbi:Mth938-like domain-containing protein [Desulfospira joergensenii]|uniref:Mth938-like domain-containing protein n=1 Tax=Desulfospira joergensenii TaxID=53329 RepID=UPI000482B585|nr:MTH938/NDUFAF3 family protein [Desulfospira joergensenii]
MKIESYTFGSMTINKRTYGSDLIIMPDGDIRENWRRESGHLLLESDIETLIHANPDLIIAGTGAYGRMNIDPGLPRALSGLGIQIKALPTEEAADLFNRTFHRDPKTGACFHLTC